jgi:hypothetical protein
LRCTWVYSIKDKQIKEGEIDEFKDYRVTPIKPQQYELRREQEQQKQPPATFSRL